MSLSTQAIWVISNGVLTAAVYIAFVHGVVDIQYLCTGFILLMLITYIGVAAFPDLRTKRRIRPMPRLIEWTVDILIFGMILHSQAYATAAAYASSCIILEWIYHSSVKSE